MRVHVQVTIVQHARVLLWKLWKASVAGRILGEFRGDLSGISDGAVKALSLGTYRVEVRGQYDLGSWKSFKPFMIPKLNEF